MRIALILIISMIPAVSLGDTLHVPADHSTIQEAIIAAVHGDVVLVAPGTYVENINFWGRAIVVMSSAGPDFTVIDGGQPVNPEKAAVVTFENGETRSSVIQGFAIFNGRGNRIGLYSERGGGIACDGASPLIRNNIIHNNSVYCIHGGTANGGGIFSNASAWIEGNVIHTNASTGYATGGGISCAGSTVVFDNVIYGNSSEFGGGVACSGTAVVTGNLIYDNYSTGGGSGIDCGGDSLVNGNVLHGNDASSYAAFRGAITVASCQVINNVVFSNLTRGITCFGSSSLQNNTVVNNQDSGIWCWEFSSPVICNSIVWGNVTGAIVLDEPSVTPVVSYCDVEGGWPGTGNIDAAPCFADPANDDFHLTYDSPCRGAGDNSAVTMQFDFENDPRIYQGAVDIGADEFHSHLYCMGDRSPGGSIEGKFVGIPGTCPVGLFIGSGVLDPPLQHMWGEFYLESPWVLFPLVPIPANGVLAIPATLPATTAPYDIPMQALIDWKLSNLFVLEVR